MESWRPVKDYEELYLVSDYGRIMSISQMPPSRIGYIFTGNPHADGYVYASLSKDGIMASVKVHRLVATSFLQNPFNKRTVNHKDGIKSNNHISNLEWATQSENVQHAYDTGLKHPNTGASNGRATLTETQAINIMHCRGSITARELSEITGIRKGTIAAIWCGENWSYLFQRENELIRSAR